MEVKFDLVRIGKPRKNSTIEIILKQNVNLLQNSIRYFLEDEVSTDKYNRIDMVMIIPSKGSSIKIALQDINDNNIKKSLRQKFPNSIYKGDYSIILDNIHNRVFR